MPQLLHSVKFTVTSLYKIPVREPAPIDRLKKYSSNEKWKLYEHFDSLYVQDKFKNLEENVAIRLGRLITRRRELIEYRELRAERLHAAAPRTDRSVSSEAQQQEQAATKKPVGSAIEATGIVPTTVAPTITGRSQHTLHSKATTRRVDTPIVNECLAVYPESIAQSMTSQASSFASKYLSVEVPPRPTGINGQELDTFVCPYCMISVYIKNRTSWRLYLLIFCLRLC